MKLTPLDSDQAVIVYLDFKSPYAYLAVEPTRQLEKELGIQFDWRPFVLDIPSYLGSASLDNDGQVASQDRSDEQWKAIKYAYYDCRRYAAISNLTIRGTTKIWDTNLVATAMLWVRETAREQLPNFIDLVYRPFWKRELDIEDRLQINAILKQCDLDSAIFERWANSEGTELNARFHEAAFNQGIYGVPTYVVDGELFFGREHLPRIAWMLGDKNSPAPDVANLLPAAPILKPAPSPKIEIGIDCSMDSLLAIPALKAILSNANVSAAWSRIASQKLDNLIPHSDTLNRGEVHRQYRELTTANNALRYGQNIDFGTGLETLITKAIDLHEIDVDDIGLSPSPFPGIFIKIDDEIFIGRQHLQLINALINPEP